MQLVNKRVIKLLAMKKSDDKLSLPYKKKFEKTID